MDMANKFLRSVEKRKKKFSISDEVGGSLSELSLSSHDLSDRVSEKSLALSDFSIKKEDNSATKTKVGSSTLMDDKELKDLLSGLSTDDDSSSSSSAFEF